MKVVIFICTLLFIVACTPKPEVNIPMPTKVRDYSGYASGDGLTAQFKITNNGKIMKYSDAITGPIVLMREKNAPIFKGQYRDGIRTSTSSSGNAMAFGNVVYGNTDTSMKTSAKINDIEVIYAYGYPYMGVKSPKHYIQMNNVITDSKQDFSAWHKKVEKLLK